MLSASTTASSTSWVTNKMRHLAQRMDAQQLAMHAGTRLRIEPRERFVHQQNIAARRRGCAPAPRGCACRPKAGADKRRRNRRARPDRAPRGARRRRSAAGIDPLSSAERDIAHRAAPRQQPVVLEHVADAAPVHRRAVLCPMHEHSAASGAIRPAARLRIVLLPEPDGPRMATTSPDWTSKLISRRTSSRLLSLRQEIFGDILK